MSRKVKYSEIFNSVQGEGHYTGVPTVWLRYHLCNLECNGFGQDEPSNPESWDLPFQTIDITDITNVEDLPVFEKGCDSSYTWAKKYRHLMSEGDVSELKQLLQDTLKTESNPDGLFKHPVSNQTSHLCFTGGEPLMRHAQIHSASIVKQFVLDGNAPASVTYETNGTQKLTDEFCEIWKWLQQQGVELFFSVSPKLWTVAGEQSKKAIKPDIVSSYTTLSERGQLKFVVGPHQEQWDEMEQHIAEFKKYGCDYPVWIMPVGATVEGQEVVAGDVATMAFERGYNVAARVHCYLWGNKIGT